MPAWLAAILDWLILIALIVAAIDALLGGILRAKLMQMLQRSLKKDIENHKAELSKELENHKSELAKNQAEHAASLAPQLGKIKHDFERELAAYKVSLIAEAEEAKAKQDVKKSIVLRYSEIEFERLVELEHIVAGLPPEVMAYAAMAAEQKTDKQRRLILDKVTEFNIANHRVGMFVSFEDKQKVTELTQGLINIIDKHVGASLPPIADNNPALSDVMQAAARVALVVRGRIKELGQL
jgi:uncharacterized membrane-anchored protein YhcB (DUF1043 family)